jgi:uncharacterized Zn finger protein
MPKKGIPYRCPTCGAYDVTKQERVNEPSAHILVTYECGHTLKSKSKIALRRFPPKENT